MKTPHLLSLFLIFLITSCSNIQNELPELNTASIDYLVLSDNHSRVVGNINGNDTTLSYINLPATFMHNGIEYNTQPCLLYSNDGVLGLTVTGIQSISTSSLAAYYGLDIVDTDQNEIYATGCDDKHTCKGVQCSSCKLSVVDCVGSCNCEIDAPGSGTGSAYCEHTVTSGGGGMLDDGTIFKTISESSTSWEDK
jgi:hypothetical protein